MDRKVRWLLVALLALPGVAIPALPAGSAERDSVADAEDVVGKLDLAELRFFKPTRNGRLIITVETHEPWGKRVLRLNVNRLVVLLDVDGDGSRDYRARIKKSGDALLVLLSGSGETFEPRRAWKPNGRTVRFAILSQNPANPAGPAPDMRARSRFIEDQACDPASGQAPCIDRAPDFGWL